METAEPAWRAEDLTSVYIIDDHPMVTEGLRSLLHGTDGFAVAGNAATAADALAGIAATRPDVIIVDLSLGDDSGLDVVRALTAEQPAIPCLVFTVHPARDHARQAFRAGARGYLDKAAPGERILEAVRAVRRGDAFLEPSVAGELTNQGHEPGQLTRDTVREKLTAREHEVFGLLGGGLSTGEIADRLGVSRKTVQAHCDNIKRKLRLANALRLYRAAFEYARVGR